LKKQLFHPDSNGCPITLSTLDLKKFKVKLRLIVSLSPIPLSNDDHLIVFTRYPQASTTKTRLIPALGAAGAAQLHRHLAEWTLHQALQLCATSLRSPSVEVRFVGSSLEQMQAWLGSSIRYLGQGDGDLGQRMARSFQDAFQMGSQRVIVIGTDCPSLDVALLEMAFAQLETHELVLGPAEDGGYYLIGLSRFIPDLFIGIPWGSDQVFDLTLKLAQQQNLSYFLLPQHSDIDRPEDLAKVQFPFKILPVQPQISIIIPVLNDAPVLQTTLAHLKQITDVATTEIIVVDGGSEDDTLAVAQNAGVKILESSASRAHQMNVGAGIATGEILLFLHADTQLPTQFETMITETLAQPDVLAGAFELQIDSPHWALRWIETGVKWRSRWLQLPYGDQAIFMPAQVWQRLDGFREMVIMEDFDMMRRLKPLGPIHIVPVPVKTSARRWQKLGILKTTLINQLMIMGYFLGISPERLAHWYRRRPL
jgi:rSAM/selenodomain-associated transferase 2/rSAM/selenodomain-associated transferase 1